MPRGQRITKIRFLSIAKDLTLHTHDSQSTVAQRHHVSQGTISKVNRTRIWGNFLTDTNAPHTVQQLSRLASKRYQLTAATGHIRLTNSSSQPEKQLSKALQQLELNPVEYVTTKQFTDAMDSLNGKIKQDRYRADIHREEIDALKTDVKITARILSRIQQLKPRWFREEN